MWGKYNLQKIDGRSLKWRKKMRILEDIEKDGMIVEVTREEYAALLRILEVPELEIITE